MTDSEKTSHHPTTSEEEYSASSLLTDDTLGVAIVARVAAEKGVEPLALEPLYETIRADVLGDLFAPTDEDDQRAAGHVTFTYSGYQVTVTSRETIEIEPLDEDT